MITIIITIISDLTTVSDQSESLENLEHQILIGGDIGTMGDIRAIC